MLTVHFLDSDEFAFSPADRGSIDGIAAAAEKQLRAMLPVVERLHLLVEPSDAVLSTGDNASTLAPHLLRWMADPALGVIDVARRHLAQALAHEAFHAARFRQLPPEVDGGCWENVAIAEGHCLRPRRLRGHEAWSACLAGSIESWPVECLPSRSMRSRCVSGSSTTPMAARSSPSVSGPGWSTSPAPILVEHRQTSSGYQRKRCWMAKP